MAALCYHVSKQRSTLVEADPLSQSTTSLRGRRLVRIIACTMQVSNRQCRSSISALRQHSRETLAHTGFPRPLRLIRFRTSVIVCSFNDNLVDVQSGQLPRGTAAAGAAAGGAAAPGPSYSQNNLSAQQAQKNRQQYSTLLGRVSPVLVLAGAATAILCGVTLVWLSTTGALTPAAGAADGGQFSSVTAAAGVVAQKSAAALGGLLHHLWVTLAEVGRCLALTEHSLRIHTAKSSTVIHKYNAVSVCFAFLLDLIRQRHTCPFAAECLQTTLSNTPLPYNVRLNMSAVHCLTYMHLCTASLPPSRSRMLC
jgi:hypothetical protein